MKIFILIRVTHRISRMWSRRSLLTLTSKNYPQLLTKHEIFYGPMYAVINVFLSIKGILLPDGSPTCIFSTNFLASSIVNIFTPQRNQKYYPHVDSLIPI